VLFTLLLADEADGAFSTERAVPVSVSALAKTFAVSRKHVLAVLREAEQHGLLRRIGDRGEQVVLQQKLIDAVNSVIVGAFWQLSQSARAARREVGLA
jgi:CTP-dependent riboflavin kinase